MLQGNTPWPSFSKRQLFNACTKLSLVLDQVDMREKAAKEMSDATRKMMLKSEFEAIREIRTSLNIARLGPAGGKDYRSKVTTEAVRQDFEKTFRDKKAFKLFMKSLDSVNSTARARPNGRPGLTRQNSAPRARRPARLHGALRRDYARLQRPRAQYRGGQFRSRNGNQRSNQFGRQSRGRGPPGRQSNRQNRF